MQLKPDELPDLEEGEIRRVSVKLAGVTGVNTISDADISCDNLTIGTPSISGTNVSFLVTASQVGTHYILIAATLSSGEEPKAYVRAKVNAAPCPTSSNSRYDDD